MKLLLCYMWSTFCVIIVAGGHSGLRVSLSGPIENCPDFDEEKSKIDLSELTFVETSDYDFVLSGKYKIKENIDGPISIRVTSKKYERGSWVDSLMNQNIQDVCEEMKKQKRPDWLKILAEWTDDGKCPFIEKVGEFNELVFYNSKTVSMLPPNLYGKYRSESRFQRLIDGDVVDFGCSIWQSFGETINMQQ